MQQNYFGKLFLSTALVSTIFIACEPDNDPYNGSPAQQIAASEQLVIPAAVNLPADPHTTYTRVATFYAKGVQKYKAQLKAGTTDTYEWVLAGPDAKLYDASNKKVGSHGFGPHWEISPADSIFAQHFSPQRTSPSPEPNTVAWLLLMPKVGTTPTGIFADVDYIQRIGTQGGAAPSAPPASIDETTDVKYTAIYRFTKRN
jgi:hypothetical protein